ncbi:AGE family epimerase/isomerase [Epibacterium sp. MM17-32]|uniref:AGE family epimerase/isomerase n=1 Tax=Epibacterium sp. MM17-32 TaxID=2917734 RepID=UPI001EF3E926|nr:AGE family epimerase/isomerase [Epibacterium sp. MM17-32]MCG7630042.1 AGE family epimerase/isomerase [Epibacterium sp. MM17-32]
MSTAPDDWIRSPDHRAFLSADARRQFDFFKASVNPAGGFFTLGIDGAALPSPVQELHSTTRLIHSYALGQIAGHPGCEAVIDHGMAYLQSHHLDREHGGFLWALSGQDVQDGRKLAYGHVFVLLAASSALAVAHPGAPALLAQIDDILDSRFWDEARGLFVDEWNRDWTPFSSYRGLNANMHGVEALLAAYEATGRARYLERAGRILDFLIGRIAPVEGWRLPEHYTEDWQVDRSYSGNPMFRPAGTTPGHSFELARLLLHYDALCPASEETRIATARTLAYRALEDAWDAERGGFVYTLDFDGKPAIRDRYWWPVTEAIGVVAALLKVEPQAQDGRWYSRLWNCAERLFIDSTRGGWVPEVDDAGVAVSRQFQGKPDIYHSVQAALFPLAPSVAGHYRELAGVLAC